MKKSEIYQEAMRAVLRDYSMCAGARAIQRDIAYGERGNAIEDETIEIIKQLIADRDSAIYWENKTENADGEGCAAE